jgi:putative phosphoesterase
MLNIYKKKIIAVRGNCDSEVDQMMLEYPIMSDYSTVWADGQRFFLTHGHIWNGENVPPVTDGTILAHGHTHIPVLEQKNGLIIFNPGSIAIPKQENLPTYGIWDNGILSVRTLKDGSIYREMQLSFR